MAEPNLSLKRSKQTGMWLAAASSVVAVVFLIGVLQGAYWALAIPVAVMVFTALGFVFWVAYTINTVDVVPEAAEHYHGMHPKKVAIGIIAGAAVLGGLFLAGVLSGSYLALALPVSILVLGLCLAVFSIGWAIMGEKSTMPQFMERYHTAQQASASDASQAGRTGVDEGAGGYVPVEASENQSDTASTSTAAPEVTPEASPDSDSETATAKPRRSRSTASTAKTTGNGTRKGTRKGASTPKNS